MLSWYPSTLLTSLSGVSRQRSFRHLLIARGQRINDLLRCTEPASSINQIIPVYRTTGKLRVQPACKLFTLLRLMADNVANDSVGARIRLVRTKRGWTLEQVAEKAGISKSFLSEVERGSDIGGERLLRVANALGASLDYLMRGVTTDDELKPTSVEIPAEVNALAQEAGLTYRQTLALLEIDRSVKAHRRDERRIRDKAYWERLYEAVKPFLEEKR